jgi:hypothetical protein
LRGYRPHRCLGEPGIDPGVDLPAHALHKRFKNRVPVLGPQLLMGLRGGAQFARGQRRIGHITTVYRARWRPTGPGVAYLMHSDFAS